MSSKIREKINKATSSSLREDNWQYILDVCDAIRKDPEDYGNQAVECILMNLKQNDANVIMRTLSLILSMAENCGSRIKQQIDNKRIIAVLNDLIENPIVHVTVKTKLVEIVRQLSKSFKSDPSLRYISDFYKQIKSNRKYSHLITNVKSKSASSTRNVRPPSDINLRSNDEDEDFQKALRLSLREFEVEKEKNESKVSQSQPEMQAQTHTQALQQSQILQQNGQPQKPNIIRKVRAMYELISQEENELSFRKGDVITVLEQVYRDWWRGTLHGKIGIFPLNYVTPIIELSNEDIIKENQQENNILSQKANIDQLQDYLQNMKNTGDLNLQDQQVNDLYGSVTPLRPQIAKMIGKYSQKKDDLTSLRQVLANAEVDYNKLLDRAASAYIPPPTPQSQVYQSAYDNRVELPQQPAQINSNMAPHTLQQPYNNYPHAPQQISSQYMPPQQVQSQNIPSQLQYSIQNQQYPQYQNQNLPQPQPQPQNNQ
ncbi:hypothetical protein TPHA_0C04020 [Tetrapisispora phaffii CBS 4417]|uniref:Class E vacuolar protein-sorting machinery protein HSE1 n=1 Tax=Tetrapisispora phaffii (strain ATCC 24235 / CBS 4417 / NBRC 1672 / NRRL Y-8282 / UCD 70-5) TaxID=1071381 RepID=G8BQP0_TETPH|nr:hypothetical protein TPHA_0C04020 [Tetrapisispora phaffii CBS 4417]CCE62552.1 hypothetical protein TPHA_0C04020 [Tetrapisispora phaffii CBS 4417]